MCKIGHNICGCSVKEQPASLSLDGIRRVLRYLKGAMEYGKSYSGEPLILELYSDGSSTTNDEDNSSTSGRMFVYGEGAIS